MSIQYYGMHSVIFITVDGDTVETKNSWDDLFLVPGSKLKIGATTPLIGLQNAPGSDRPMDLSRAFGDLLYSYTEQKFSFMVDTDRYGKNSNEVQKQLSSYFNGQYMYIVLEDFPNYIYYGRVYLSDFKSGSTYPTLELTCELNGARSELSTVKFEASGGRHKICVSPYPGVLDDIRKELVYNTFLYPNYAQLIYSNGIAITPSYRMLKISNWNPVSNESQTIQIRCGKKSAIHSIQHLDVLAISASFSPNNKFLIGSNEKDIRDRLTVSANFGGSQWAFVSAYKLKIDTLSVGNNSVRISYGTKFADLQIEIYNGSGITVSNNAPTNKFIVGDSISTIKKYLVVNIEYEEQTKILNSDDYELICDTSSVGPTTASVYYNNLTTSIQIQINDKSSRVPPEEAGDDILYVYESNGINNSILTDDSVSKIKDYLTVALRYYDVDRDEWVYSEIDKTKYTVDGDFSTSGIKTVTIAYSGYETTINVEVHNTKAELLDHIVVYNYISDPIVSSNSLNDRLDTIKKQIEVSAGYIDYLFDGTNILYEEVDLDECVFSGDISSPGTTTIVVSYLNKTASFEVSVAEVVQVRMQFNKPNCYHFIVSPTTNTLYNFESDYKVFATLEVDAYIDSARSSIYTHAISNTGSYTIEPSLYAIDDTYIVNFRANYQGYLSNSSDTYTVEDYDDWIDKYLHIDSYKNTSLRTSDTIEEFKNSIVVVYSDLSGNDYTLSNDDYAAFQISDISGNSFAVNHDTNLYLGECCFVLFYGARSIQTIDFNVI